MNPVASDLMITALRTEAERELARRHAAALIPASPQPTFERGLRAISRFVRQVIDPRGFALAEALKLTSPHETAPVPLATVTRLEPMQAMPYGDELADAA